MSDADKRALWDRKYDEGLPSLTKPDPYFASAYERLVDRSFPTGGTALDLAAGLGRHALWLAHRGWQVSAVDISEVAMEKLGQAASQLNDKTKTSLYNGCREIRVWTRTIRSDRPVLSLGPGAVSEDRFRLESWGLVHLQDAPALGARKHIPERPT